MAEKKDVLLRLCENNVWPDAIAKLKGGKLSAAQINHASAKGLTSLHFAVLEEKLEAIEL